MNERSVSAVLLLLLGAAVMWCAGVHAYRWHLLQGATGTTRAVVMRARPPACRDCGAPWQVWYAFSLPGRRGAFHYSDPLLMGEAPARMPWTPRGLDEIDSRLSVRYSLRDPRINQPSHFPMPRLLDWLGWAGFAALVLLGGVWRARPASAGQALRQ